MIVAAEDEAELTGAIALGEDASEYAVYIANVTAQLSRDDPYGLRYVVESECDPRGLVRFFKKLGGLESGEKTSWKICFPRIQLLKSGYAI